MSVSELLEEYDLSPDDIRWFLATQLAESLLLDRDEPEKLVRRIWSGALEAQLYNAEERYLTSLQDDLSTGRTDEPVVREQLERARITKIQRR